MLGVLRLGQRPGGASSDEEAVRNAVRRCHIPANLSDSTLGEIKLKLRNYNSFMVLPHLIQGSLLDHGRTQTTNRR